MAFVLNQAEFVQGGDFIINTSIVTNTATALEIYRFTPANFEVGSLEVFYTAVDAAGNAATKIRVHRYKKSATAASVVAPVTVFAPTPDTGFTAVDYTITAIGTDVVVTVTGNTANVRHSFTIERYSSVLEH